MKSQGTFGVKLACLLFLALFSIPCFAGAGDASIVPDKPQPQAKKILPAADREFWIEAGAVGAAWTVDAITTYEAIHGNPFDHEEGYLLPGSRSTPAIMGAWAGVDAGSLALAYEWKEHVHNRFLHPLWRLPMIWRVEGHFQGTAENLSVIRIEKKR